MYSQNLDFTTGTGRTLRMWRAIGQSTWRAREAEERGRKRRAAPPARRGSAVGAGGIGGLGGVGVGVGGGGRGKDLWKDEEVFTGNSADNSEEVHAHALLGTSLPYPPPPCPWS